jgi:hypothetical protein
MPEITGPQRIAANLSYSSMGRRISSGSVDYAAYRQTRKDPTVSLVRTIIAAAITSAGWNYKSLDGTPDDRVAFIRRQIERVRARFTETAVHGGTDFGWSPWEMMLVFKYDYLSRRWFVEIGKLKALMHDITDILVDDNDGFLGFQQTRSGVMSVVLPASITSYEGTLNCAIIVPWRMEGTDWHGTPLLANVKDFVTQWNTENAGVKTWVLHVTGSRYVVSYPDQPGGMESPWGDAGVLTKHYEIANLILAGLEAGNGVVIPTTAARAVEELNALSMGWKIEPLEDKGAAPLVMDHLTYLDVNKVRGMGFPERTVLEGAAQGQKAGSETAQGFAIANLRMMSAYLAAVANEFIIDPLLAWNYGEAARGSVYAVANPVGDDDKALLSDIIKEVLKTQPEKLDLDSAMDAAGIPKSKEVTNADRLNAATASGA